MKLHVCLIDTGEGESRVNHNVFVEAAMLKCREVPELRELIHFQRNQDALVLANTLSQSQPVRAGMDDEIRRVGVLNGANNKLLGNHWFSEGARRAIDENLHRRCTAMCVGSLLLNLATKPLQRDHQELARNVELFGGRVVEMPPYPESHAGAPGAPPPNSILARISIRPYGVLGTQWGHGRDAGLVATEPGADTVFVDPAGLPFIDSGPCGAGGASGAIYAFLGINHDRAFPDDVRAAIKREGQAKFHAYGERRVIHVVGPNFGGRRIAQEEAIGELAQAYINVFSEFLNCGITTLRLLPISGAIFAGQFKSRMPEMTAQAINIAFEQLQPEARGRLLAANMEMCIYDPKEVAEFDSAFKQEV